MLNPRVVSQIWDRFGRAAMDLFCFMCECAVSQFFSRDEREAPLGIDALAHKWPDHLLLLHFEH